MANFSQDPAAVLAYNRARGYVGIHIEQGVPVLDRDLNLLNDLISATVRSVLANYIGNGVATDSDAFRIRGEGLANDFWITGPGVCLVNGWEVFTENDRRYNIQQGVAPLTPPPPAGRQDIVYLDVWTSEVNGETDFALLNDADVGMQTSVRQRLEWRVRVAEGVAIPEPVQGHAHYQLATMRRSTPEVTAANVTDTRQTRLNLAEIEQRLRLLETDAAPAFGAPGRQFEPRRARTGDPITLLGSNFDVGGEPTVLFGTIPATVVSFGANEIVATVPEGLDPANSVPLTVRTRGGEVTSDDTFDLR